MSEKKLIDDSFYVKEQSWGTWNSYDLNSNELITALTEEDCISSTRWYLKMKQENALENVGTSYEGTVGGKL